MNANIAASLDRSDELLKELLAEYDRSLKDKAVSARALQLTHEICERLRSTLDRIARMVRMRPAPAVIGPLQPRVMTTNMVNASLPALPLSRPNPVPPLILNQT